MPFILTSISGLSTLLGGLTLIIKNKNHNKILAISMAFASIIMFLISILDLIPESIKLLKEIKNKNLIIILFILIGISITYILDKILPQEKSLYKVGLLSAIVIIIHNIPEGIATYLTSYNNIKLGIKLSISIALHNIPEGISIALPIYYSTKNKNKAWKYILISALSEPFGALLTSIFLKNIITNQSLAIIYLLTSGIMIYISLLELLPTSIKYKEKKLTLIGILLGVLIIVLNIIINK